MTPTRSYLIWFTQRVGSTLLAQALEDTGIAGRPREWFNGRLPETSSLQQWLWAHATGANGVLGVKYGMLPELHARLTAAFSPRASGDELAAWSAVFPRCKHVFMTRRNRVRLAVSWWRAIKSGEWHRPMRDDTAVGRQDAGDTAALEAAYDASAIDHLVREASLREAAIQELFDRWHVVPYTIVYEDFVARYDETVKDVLAFLDVPAHQSVVVPRPAFAAASDDVSQRWYDRYCAEHPLP
jgi:LPS sulfotransferase NodH